MAYFYPATTFIAFLITLLYNYYASSYSVKLTEIT